MNVAGDIDDLTTKLRGWLIEAEEGKSPVYEDGEVVAWLPDLESTNKRG
ncbi:MAG TPA: hypothetical protein VH081_05390 [Solirubrobacteraceae bacterium]|jgi:hypothetical protein|nr:hypothetical protein [Solirubrobacteraceae bacterium]